jgi:heme-degrading monooxygenase HmoA
LTREEFRAWRDSPLTKTFFKLLEEQIASAQRAWVEERIVDATVQAKTSNMNWIVNLEWDDLNAFFGWEATDEAAGPDA